MTQDIFTHDFKFDVANTIVSGEVEFDTDNEVSMNIKQAGIPLKADTMQIILDIFELLKQLHETDNFIKVVRIKKKDAEE